MQTLRLFKPNSVKIRISVSYRIARGSKIAVVAPHGGAIEPGTSELAIAISRSDLSFAVFEGIKAKKTADLHITQQNFDEPRCVNVVAQAIAAVTIHGEASQGAVAYMVAPIEHHETHK